MIMFDNKNKKKIGMTSHDKKIMIEAISAISTNISALTTKALLVSRFNILFTSPSPYLKNAYGNAVSYSAVFIKFLACFLMPGL